MILVNGIVHQASRKGTQFHDTIYFFSSPISYVCELNCLFQLRIVITNPPTLKYAEKLCLKALVSFYTPDPLQTSSRMFFCVRKEAKRYNHSRDSFHSRSGTGVKRHQHFFYYHQFLHSLLLIFN